MFLGTALAVVGLVCRGRQRPAICAKHPKDAPERFYRNCGGGLVAWGHIRKGVAPTVVVAELLFLDNALMDALVLLLAAALLRRKLAAWRVAAAAALGGAYALLVLLPGWGDVLAFVACKLACCAGMAAIAFGVWRVKPLLVDAGATLLAAFLLGGASLGLFFLLGDGALHMAGSTVYMGVGMRFCILGSFAGVGLWRWLRRLFENAAREDAFGYRMDIRLGEDSASLEALLDSGNALTEPLSGDPVAVVRRQALGTLLPADWPHSQREGQAVACRMVPYKGVDGLPRLLPAFRPDALTLRPHKGESWVAQRIYVAVLDGEGWEGYDALFGVVRPLDGVCG